MENIKKEDLEKKDDLTPESPEKPETPEAGDPEKQDPLKTELERVQKAHGRTEAEKAAFSLKKNAERARELGLDPNTIIGAKPEDDDPDNQPVTRGELQKIISAGATKTALQLAEEIEDPTEKELVKFYLENRIMPSGNAQEDLRDARRMVNSVRNEQIVTELNRKTPPKNHSSGSSGPAKQTEPETELTAVEMRFMKPPFNVKKADILKARKG